MKVKITLIAIIDVDKNDFILDYLAEDDGDVPCSMEETEILALINNDECIRAQYQDAMICGIQDGDVEPTFVAEESNHSTESTIP